MTEQFVKLVKPIGNSGGVYVPRQWVGGQVVIKLIKKPLDIKRDILQMLNPYLSDVMGIFLYGSYARDEQTSESDIDILVVTSKKIPPLHKNGRYHIVVVEIENLKKTMVNTPFFIYPIIKESKPLLNGLLLQELKKYKITPDNLRWYIDDTRGILEIVSGLLDVEEESVPCSDIPECVYSLILHLKGCYILNCILDGKPYTFKGLVVFAQKQGIDIKTFYELYKIYRSQRDNKPVYPSTITVAVIKKLCGIENELIKKQEVRLIGQKEIS